MENDKITTSYDETAAFFFFLAFLRYKIDQDRVKQINIARAIGVRPEYVNRVYKGRQSCSVDVQEKICRFFGISYLDALAIGRQLVQRGIVPSTKCPQPENSPQSFVDKSRRIEDGVSEADIVSIVSRWVTQKKETADALIKLQNIIENLSEGFVILDTNLIIEYQNRSHREMFGASLVGQACYTAHGCEKFVRDYPSLVSRQTGMPASGFFPYGTSTVSVLTTPIRDLSGQIIGYVEVLRDITEIEKKLILTEESLRMIDRAVLVYDQDRKIRLYNQKIKEITGASDNDLSTIDKFQNYLQENRIYANFDDVVAMLEKSSRDKEEASINILFSNGKTYFYTTKPMYTRDMYIGRIGIFTPSD